MEVVGFLAKEVGQSEAIDLRLIVGTYEQLEEVVERYGVQTIVVCVEDRRAGFPTKALLDMKVKGWQIVDGQSLYEEEAGRLAIDHLRPSMVIFSAGFERRSGTMLAKRCVDCVVSVAGLTLLFPLFLLIGVVIKLDSEGPVFYRQLREGANGRQFTMWKFRSMRQDAERSGAAWASERDPRVSRVGRWLRKWRLDELPQLVNVLKGEMSFVGPRPERPVFVRELRSTIPYYDIRHVVKPGITGWAQTRFRYGASKEDAHVKLQYDLYYVKHLSLALDLRIMVRTIRVVLAGEGAR
jgi:sugar transferase (PEP-CTERM system associated)